jgi:hypothetical protein
MVLRKIGTPKKIFSSTQPTYEEGAVWIETDGSSNILNQYVGFFDQWLQVDVQGSYPIHFDQLGATEPTPRAGESWLAVTSYVTNTISSPTTGTSTYEFDISSLPDVFNFDSITIEGSRTTTNDSVSQTGVTDSDTLSFDVGGTIPAEDASVTFTGIKNTNTKNYSGNSTGTTSISVDGNKEPQNVNFNVELGSDSYSDSVNFDSAAKDVNTLSFTIPNDWPEQTYHIDLYARGRCEGTSVVTDYSETLNVEFFVNGSKEDEDSDSWGWDYRENVYSGCGFDDDGFFGRMYIDGYVSAGPGDTITANATKGYPDFSPRYGSSSSDISASDPKTGTTTVETSTGSVANVQNDGTTSVPLSTSDSSITVSHSGEGLQSWSFSFDDITQTSNPSLTVDGETVSYSGDMTDGETATRNLSDLTPGTYDASISVDGPVDIDSSWTEVTQTQDPSVDINGNTISESGLLSDGEAVSLDAEKSWLTEGTNTVEVTNGEPLDLIIEYDEVDSSASDTTIRLYYSDGTNWIEI